MGLNECAGYLAVASTALAAGYLAATYGPRPAPYFIALGAAVLGLVVTFAAARDTAAHVELEHASATSPNSSDPSSGSTGRPGQNLWSGARLWAANQAGLVNNLKEGVVWGLLPIYFAGQDLDLRQIGWLTGMYPAVWGLVQLGTGPLSDRIGRRSLIVGGLLLQAVALIGFTTLHGFAPWIATVVTLGVGTALVYPTLIAQVGDVAGSALRASAVGRYRLWRDLGYVVGGLLAGLLKMTHTVLMVWERMSFDEP